MNPRDPAIMIFIIGDLSLRKGPPASSEGSLAAINELDEQSSLEGEDLGSCDQLDASCEGHDTSYDELINEA